MNIAQLRVRQELIGNELMDVCCDYPDQIRPIIDELVSLLNDNQLDQVEDLIVNNYGEEYQNHILNCHKTATKSFILCL